MSDYEEDIFVKRMKVRFSEYKIDFDKFMKQLIENKGLISGSFCLQIIQDEKYENSDIDVFFHSIVYANIFQQYLADNYEIKCKTNGSSYATNSNVLSSLKYGISNVQINVIATENLSEHISNFDLSFCRSSFDGTNFVFSDETLKKQGFINLNKLYLGSFKIQNSKTSLINYIENNLKPRIKNTRKEDLKY